MAYQLPIGATVTPTGTHFRVWAGRVRRVDLVLFEYGTPTTVQPMQPADAGYFEIELPGVGTGTQYMYRLDGATDRPDPASRFQPQGVHGPSQVVDPAAFAWSDGGWHGLALDDTVIYELHIGTFTPNGTFDSAIEKLDELVALGITAIELMPVADFPGERNWGYDGVSLFAPARAYGGPEALRRLVDAAHKRGLAVLLDVVYNHLGPDGNYLRDFSQHYFTHKHVTPWGDALNFDDQGAVNVRAFFSGNACYWANEYHLDGLRLDATHELKDDSQPHILAEIAAAVHASIPANRKFLLIAEDERNAPMLVRGQGSGVRGQEREVGGEGSGVRGQGHDHDQNNSPALQRQESSSPGYGLDALWADDFHHQVRVALTGEREAYFRDFSGSAADLAATMRQGWFYIGQQSENLGEPRGAPADDLALPAFIHHIQNHDQVGNRALGDRLSSAVSLDAYRAVSALLLCSPFTPMLWQGQEWAASTPFLFFTDHNAELGRLITEGRRREFARFAAFIGETVPDPQAESTFTASKLDWHERAHVPHTGVLQLYRDLLHLRRSSPALRNRDRRGFAVQALGNDGLALTRRGEGETLLLIVNLRSTNTYPNQGNGDVLLSSEATRYGGGEGARREGGSLVFSGPGALLLRGR